MGSYTCVWQTHSDGGDARDAGVDIKAKRTADGANKPMYLIKLRSGVSRVYRLSRRPRQSSSTGVHRATSVPPAFVSSLQQPDDSGLVRRTVPPPTSEGTTKSFPTALLTRLKSPIGLYCREWWRVDPLSGGVTRDTRAVGVFSR